MKKDVKNKLRLHLLKGKTVTSNQALRWWKTSRIAIYVCRLRNEGMRKTLKTEMVHKNGDCFARYRHEI